MKKVLFIITIVICTIAACSQIKDGEFDDGSNVIFPAIDEQIVDNLELLGRLWGFLKYNHPEIGKGNYNWDYELFRVLPDYLKSETIQQRDDILLNWIEKYGKITICTNCNPTSADAFLKPDLSWIENSSISQDLKKKIEDIYSTKHRKKHHYIRLIPGVRNPDFLNENQYSNHPYPDSGFRLLSLYRYWNMVQYFSPNRHLTDKDWNTVLKEYIPKFLAAKDELEYELIALQIIGELNDTHANLHRGGDKIANLRGGQYAPFRVEFIENKLAVTDYYNPELEDIAWLKIGDIITHIDGRTVESIVDSLKPYYPASNEAAMLRNISADLLRSRFGTININYISSGLEKQKELTLYHRDKLNMYNWYRVNEDERCYKFLDNNIGYITLATIKREDITDIKESFKNAAGIIIDIRNYPSTFVPFLLGSYFVSGSTPFVKFTKGNINNPGEFAFTSAIEIQKAKESYLGKLVVLVNEKTQSQAEYTAMAFRAGMNTTIIGSTTAGADGNVSTILLPGGLQTAISGIGVFYPDGTDTQRVGIIPDITIRPTLEGIKNGRDEVLEKAIEIIKQ